MSAAIASPSASQAWSARAWGLALLGKGGTQVIQLASMLVLARLLAPADFGLIAMVMSAVGIANLVRDLGLSSATIRQLELSPSQINTLFWINAGLGTLMALLVAALSPVLGQLFTDHRVGGVTLAMSVTFLLGGLNTQHMALLQREMRFASLARVNLSAALTTALIAIGLAWYGAGYWSLVCAAVAGALTSVLAAWTECRWRPGAPAFDPRVKPMLSFGGYVLAFGVLGYFGQNLHNLMIGALWGAAAVGLFNRAFLLLNLALSYVQDPLNLMTPPALARVQAQPQALADGFLKSVGQTMLLAAPLSAICLLLSPDLVHLLLGAQWESSAHYLRLLAIGVVPQALCFTTGWLYLARGNARRMMQWGIWGWSFLVLMLIGGSRFGSEGIALANSLAMILLVWPCMAYACRGEPVTPIQMLRAALPAVVAAAFATLPAWGVATIAQSLSLASRLALSLPCYGVAYLGLLMLAPTQRAQLNWLLRRLRRDKTAPV